MLRTPHEYDVTTAGPSRSATDVYGVPPQQQEHYMMPHSDVTDHSMTSQQEKTSPVEAPQHHPFASNNEHFFVTSPNDRPGNSGLMTSYPDNHSLLASNYVTSHPGLSAQVAPGMRIKEEHPIPGGLGVSHPGAGAAGKSRVMSPIDMDYQEMIKSERKRMRNRYVILTDKIYISTFDF